LKQFTNKHIINCLACLCRFKKNLLHKTSNRN